VSIVLGGQLSSDALVSGGDRVYVYEDYLMYVRPCGENWTLTVVLRGNLPPRALLKSYVHALVFSTGLQRALVPRLAAVASDRWMGVMGVPGDDANDCDFRRFEAALEKSGGWDLKRIVLCPGEWRHEWEGLGGGRT